MSIKIICDLCKNELLSHDYLVRMQIREFSIERKYWIGRHIKHVCDECVDKIFNQPK